MVWLARLLINAAALIIAALLIPGIAFEWRNPVVVLVVALIFGLVNTFIRPIVATFTCLLSLLTLGLFTLVINALMLLLTSYVASLVGYGRSFHVDGFLAAFLGALIVSIVSALLNRFVR